MKYSDLHIHSNFSDGVYSPEEIIDYARRNNVKNISITDHDSIASQYIISKEHKDINIIPGIELSSEYNDIELHILGYFIDIKNNDLIKLLNELSKHRVKRVEEILFNLKKYDININIEDLELDYNATIGRSHVANAMVNKGYFDNYKSAFKSYLVKGKPGYVKGFKLNYRDALELINSSGGIAVLAHPGQIYRKIEVENILRELKCFGLKGMEVYHPSHSKDDINRFFNLSKKYKLCISGGSDFHGRELLNNEPVIGSCGLDEEKFNKFINYINNIK